MNAAPRWKISLLLIAALSIAGCATERSDAGYWGAVAQASGAVLAPAVRPYTAAEQRRAAAELARLPPDSVVAAVMIPDYLRMRDQARKAGR